MREYSAWIKVRHYEVGHAAYFLGNPKLCVVFNPQLAIININELDPYAQIKGV